MQGLVAVGVGWGALCVGGRWELVWLASPQSVETQCPWWGVWVLEAAEGLGCPQVRHVLRWLGLKCRRGFSCLSGTLFVE